MSGVERSHDEILDSLPAHYFDCDRFNAYDYGVRRGDCDCTATADFESALAEVSRLTNQLDVGGAEWSRMATAHDALIGECNGLRAERDEAQARLRRMTDEAEQIVTSRAGTALWAAQSILAAAGVGVATPTEVEAFAEAVYPAQLEAISAIGGPAVVTPPEPRCEHDEPWAHGRCGLRYCRECLPLCPGPGLGTPTQPEEKQQ